MEVNSIIELHLTLHFDGLRLLRLLSCTPESTEADPLSIETETKLLVVIEFLM